MATGQEESELISKWKHLYLHTNYSLDGIKSDIQIALNMSISGGQP